VTEYLGQSKTSIKGSNGSNAPKNSLDHHPHIDFGQILGKVFRQSPKDPRLRLSRIIVTNLVIPRMGVQGGSKSHNDNLGVSMSLLTCSFGFNARASDSVRISLVMSEDGYTASKFNVTLTAQKTVEIYAKMWHPLPYKVDEPKVLASV
jgi:hypothetical protein